MIDLMSKEHVLEGDASKMVTNAIELEEKTVGDIMTPIGLVYMLEENKKITRGLLSEVYQKGFSRIPVYRGSRENVIGILLSRDLIMINPDKVVIKLGQL